MDLSKNQIDDLVSVVADHSAPEQEWVQACQLLGDYDLKPKKRGFPYALPLAALLLLFFFSTVPWYAHYTQTTPFDNLVPPPPPAVFAPDLPSYLGTMESAIKAHWAPPENSAPVVVDYQLDKSGEVKNLRLLSPSGQTLADRAALVAVQNSSPFQPLPPGAGDFVEVQFTFEQNDFTWQIQRAR